MKDQQWDLNQTWPAGRKWRQFTNAPHKFLAPLIWGTKTPIFYHIFLNFSTRHHISPEQNVASTNKKY